MSEFAGTLPWMSPEIMKGEPVNKACDVWSYGVVLWELFTGEKPFSDLGWNQIYIKVATENQHLPIPNECPEILEKLMLQCWQIEAKERPTFKQILTILDQKDLNNNEIFKTSQIKKKFYSVFGNRFLFKCRSVKSYMAIFN